MGTRTDCVRRAGLALVLVGLVGCGPRGKPLVYQDDRGFRLTAPPGWVERARADAVPAGAQAGSRVRREQVLPLPPLGEERLLVRYDRLTAGHLAWLRVGVADVPSSVPLAACLSAPAEGWRADADVEDLEMGGLPAARAAFLGRWEGQEYRNESVAVRKGEQVYRITASFPAADDTAREQVRQAAAGAEWK
jgi:hypothetical protein